MRILRTTTLFFLAFVLSVTGLRAQTADEILEKHIAAIGGRDNWNKVHSIAMAGTLSAGEQVAEFSTTVVDGKGFRQDFTLSGVTGYKIVTPTAGWMFIPGAGDNKVNELTKEELNDAKTQLYVKGNLIEYKARGAKVEYQGKERTEGQDCYKLKLTEANGKSEYLYINTENYYLVSSLTHAKMLNKEMDVATVYKEYEKQPEGIVIATTISTQGSNIHFATIGINKPVDENIFKPAAK